MKDKNFLRRMGMAWVALLGAALVAPGCGATVPHDTAESAVEATREGARRLDKGAEVRLVAAPAKDGWIVSMTAGQGQDVHFATADGGLWHVDPGTAALTRRGAIPNEERLMLVPHSHWVIAMNAPPRVLALDGGIELLRFNAWAHPDLALVSPGGKHFVLARGAELGFWDLTLQAEPIRAGERMQDFLARQEALQTLALPATPSALAIGESGLLAVALDDAQHRGLIWVWEPALGADLRFIGRVNRTVTEIVLAPGDNLLAATDGSGAFWVAQTARKGLLDWSEGVEAVDVGWTPSGNLLIHQANGLTRALIPETGDELWQRRDERGLRACTPVLRNLLCTDGRELLFVSAWDGQIMARAFAQGEQGVLYASEGAHNGAAPAEWFVVSDAAGSAAPSPDAWAQMAAPEALVKVLAAWLAPPR